MSGSQTLGEFIVRTSFNASGSGEVDRIKNTMANAINLVSGIPDGPIMARPDEVSRLKEEATRHLEIAAMFAVKAATCERAPQATCSDMEGVGHA